MNVRKIQYLGDDVDPNISQTWGSKACNIHYLLQKGLPIPKGFILTHRMSITDEMLIQAITDIGGFPIAVRSSGSLEDLHGASFAGLYETFLNIRTIEECKKAINQCFKSIYHPRVHEYIQSKKMSLKTKDLTEQMNVLIQKMITPECSGVAFSMDPIKGKEEQCLIECVTGLGERLVSGKISPTMYRYHYYQSQLVEETIGSDELKLTQEQLKEVSDYCLTIQDFFRCPQDIEWCFDQSSKLWILQSRPITHITWRQHPYELTNADFKDGGISSKPCTPFMYSLYEKAFNESMGEYFYKIRLNNKIKRDEWIYHFYGIGYWNASLVKKALINIPGFNEKEFDNDLGIQKDYGANGPHVTPINFSNIIKIIPTILMLKKEYTDVKRMINKYLKAFESKDESWKKILHDSRSMQAHTFYEYYKKMINDYYFPTEKKYFRTIYNNVNYQSDFKSLIDKVEKKYNIKVNKLALMAQLDDISHLEIQKDLAALANLQRQKQCQSIKDQQLFHNFIDKHYHHGDRELDIMHPRWGEDPQRILELIEQVPKKSPATRNIYSQELKRLRQVIKKNKFYTSLEKARWFLTYREKMRELSTRAYYIVRLMTLKLSDLLVQENILKNTDDIFFLKVEEIFSILDDKKAAQPLQSTILIRKKIYNGLHNFTPPNEFGGQLKQHTQKKDDDCTTFYGVPCSSGKVQGRAFIAHTIEQASLIKKDEILVTKFTDPGWTPILGRVCGVITEVGGVLSHAAVIGREYGIPAVLNISNITRELKTGQVITLDGDNGTVSIEDER